MGTPAVTRLKVRFYEADSFGHVNHANYVRYLETGRVEALEALGIPLDLMRRQGYLLVAAAMSVTFLASARPGDVLDVITRIAELRGARSIWVQEIREATTHRLLVKAEVTGAFMTEAGRPVRVPATVREKLAAIHVPNADPASAGAGDEPAASA